MFQSCQYDLRCVVGLSDGWIYRCCFKEEVACKKKLPSVWFVQKLPVCVEHGDLLTQPCVCRAR